MTSAIERVPGVGPARRAALLKAFGSVAALRDAEPEVVAREAGIPRPLAERVLETLRSDPGGAPHGAGPAT